MQCIEDLQQQIINMHISHLVVQIQFIAMNGALKQWNELPSSSCRDSALVIIDGSLTTVGGNGSSYTNKLFTLQQRQWIEEYPPMNTARSSPAVV